MKNGTVELRPEVDYLYCPECHNHVPCIRTDLGWEVQCPRCLGECGWCHCPLRESCIGVTQGTSRIDIPPDTATPPCPFVEER